LAVIKNDVELQATLERIELFQRQVTHLRRVEADPTAYKLSAGGFLTEIDRMNREVREYLSLHPSEIVDEPALTRA
jgi:hypothetical protein